MSGESLTTTHAFRRPREDAGPSTPPKNACRLKPGQLRSPLSGAWRHPGAIRGGARRKTAGTHRRASSCLSGGERRTIRRIQPALSPSLHDHVGSGHTPFALQRWNLPVEARATALTSISDRHGKEWLRFFESAFPLSASFRGIEKTTRGARDEGLRPLKGHWRKDNWTLKYQEDSNRQFIHPAKPVKITVSGHPSDGVPAGTLKAILKQAGLK